MRQQQHPYTHSQSHDDGSGRRFFSHVFTLRLEVFSTFFEHFFLVLLLASTLSNNPPGIFCREFSVVRHSLRGVCVQNREREE
jgi:hypothetical protein